MEATGCNLSEEELLAILKGTGHEKPQGLNNEDAAADVVEDGYVAPKAEDVLKEEEETTAIETKTISNNTDEGKQELCTRFASKQWKERQAAYIEALTLVNDANERDAIVSELTKHLAVIVDDTNVSAMGFALELTALW